MLDRKKNWIQIRVKPELKEEIKVEANNLNMGISTYLKFLHGFWKKTGKNNENHN